jgi:hypothetical protein
MSVIGSNILAGASGQGGDYTIARSLRFRSSASAYLNRTFGSGGNLRTWTWSAWVKRGSLGSDQQLFGWWEYGGGYNNQHWIGFDSADTITYKLYDGLGNQFLGRRTTSQVFRDPSAWYHIVCVWDTTNATASSRMRMYINGSQVTSFSTSTDPSLNTDGYINLTSPTALHILGAVFDSNFSASPHNPFDGYMTEVQFIDGQALTPSSFGETNAQTGVWQPKRYAGTYGTNGFYLPFSDNSSTTTLTQDRSGNGNNWTANNISLTSGATYDSMTDVPTLTSATAANYATFNPLAKRRDVSTNVTFANGNLQATFNDAGGNTTQAWGTIYPTAGKYYWEITVANNASNIAIGIGSQPDQDATANTSVIYVPNGGIFRYGTSQTTAATYTTNDIIGIAYDVDSATCAFYKNNTLQYTVTGLTVIPSGSFNRGSTSDSLIANFGQRPFAYTPPTGFVALNTFNLPTPTIGATASTQANKYFNAVTWTGTNTTGNRSVTGVGFQPDFVWAKSRSAAYQHCLYDAVRGAGANKELISDNTSAEGGGNQDQYGYLSSFDSDGFSSTVGSSGQNLYFNDTAYPAYVAWNWKANGSGSTNTAGSITSTVSANTSAGFSIVTWTGAGSTGTVGHGLGVAPNFIILKRRTAAVNWYVGGSNIASAGNGTWSSVLEGLNTTAAVNTGATAVFNSTAPTSTVFTAGSELVFNGSTYVAYCFAEVAGYSKALSWTGNGSTDGVFVHCGFSPAFIIMKRTDSTSDWVIIDNKRLGYNVTDVALNPNASYAENSGYGTDFTSNGFKLRTTTGYMNANGGTYIGFAFAQNPFKYSLAR